jgi:hypothetical protein
VFGNWRTLRSRLVEPERIARETNYGTRRLGGVTSYSYSEGPVARTLRDAIKWSGKTLLHVPAPKSRRKRVAELSKLSAPAPQ